MSKADILSKFKIIGQVERQLLTVVPTTPVRIKCLDGRLLNITYSVVRLDTKVAVTNGLMFVSIDNDNDTTNHCRLFRNFHHRKNDGSSSSEDMDLSDADTAAFMTDLKKFTRCYNPIDLSEGDLLEVFEMFSKTESYKPGDLKRICEEQGIILKTTGGT